MPLPAVIGKLPSGTPALLIGAPISLWRLGRSPAPGGGAI